MNEFGVKAEEGRRTSVALPGPTETFCDRAAPHFGSPLYLLNPSFSFASITVHFGVQNPMYHSQPE